MARKYKFKTVIGHIFEYEYFIERMGKVIVILAFIVSAIILGDWYGSLRLYSMFPATIGFNALGLSILVTVLVLLTAAVSLLMPHLEPTLRPKGFRKVRDERTMLMILLIVIVILAVATTSIFLLSITGTFERIA